MIQRMTGRRAVTLIELVVTIAIIAVLIGLTIPAVQKVRAAAARSQCQNTMRQIGLGLLAYHDSRSELPPGVSDQDGSNAQPFMAWQARILPYLEHDVAWREIMQAFTIDKDFLNDPPHTWLKRVMPAFICPTDALARSPGRLAAHADYLGVEGTNQYSRNGMLFLNSRTRFADVTDGLSNTLLVGERPPRKDGIFGWWYAGWGQAKDGSADMVLGAREWNATGYGPGCPAGPYHFVPGRQDNLCDAFHFWSLHSGGANFILADGSVRFLTYGADSILPALATRAGGETESVP